LSTGTKDISVVIPTLNEGRSAEGMVYNISETIGLDNYEIIIVNSGGTDLLEIARLPRVSVYDVPREGAPQARNLGASKTSSDFLVFADSHLEFRKGWGLKILDRLKENKMSIITPTITVIGDDNSRASGFRWKNIDMEMEWLPDLKSEIHEVPFACGCCMAIGKKMFNEIDKFDSGIRFWGLEDSEICIRSWLFGYTVLCDPSIRVGHKFRNSFPYEVKWTDINYNKIWFSFSHFSSKRLAKHLKTMSREGDCAETLLMVLENKVLDRRISLFSKRAYDDDWFFERFPMLDWTSSFYS
jgi:glycosyltransferase involved in cell wall biosynthesis